VFAAWLTWGISLTTTPGADTETYQVASSALYEVGNPYLVNSERFFEEHYRYPPLLAMVWPLLAPVWYPIVTTGWLVVLWVRFREAGPWGLLLPLALFGTWALSLVSGNAAGLVTGALALVPVHRRGGAVAAAAATWLKVFPAVAILWYVGRRDWEALRWFGVTFGLLGLMQLPWLEEWVAYSTSDLAQYPRLGLSSLALGPVVWIGATLAFAVATVVYARSSRGWLYAVLTILAASPRLLLADFTTLLAHPTLLTPKFSDDADDSSRASEGDPVRGTPRSTA
jgi:hypothetical protein